MTTITYDPHRPRFADVNDYHRLLDASAYVAACPVRILGGKFSQGSWVDSPNIPGVLAAEKAGCAIVGYTYGTTSIDTFLKAFPPKKGRMPVVDFEGSWSTVAEAEADVTKLHKEWGRWPGFYGKQVWLAQGAPDNTAIKNCPYWLPGYGSVPETVPRGVGPVFAHQYTDGIYGPVPHTFPGVSGASDINSLVCSIEQFHRYVGLDPPKPGIPPVPRPFLRLASPRVRSDGVLHWKHRLHVLGLQGFVVDSPVFGQGVDHVTRNFQRHHRLAVDGIVGDHTWRAAFAATK